MRRRPASLPALKKLEKRLTRQAREAFELAHSLNPHFWRAVLDPAPIVSAPKPQFFQYANQVKLWVLQCTMLWRDDHEFIRENVATCPTIKTEAPTPGSAVLWLLNFP